MHTKLLQASPHTAPCAVVSIAVAAYAALLVQLPKLPHAGKSRRTATAAARTSAGSASSRSTIPTSSSSGSSSCCAPTNWHALPPANLVAEHLKASWELACQHLSNLPATHGMLLSQLGCSSLSAVFCAEESIGLELNSSRNTSSRSRSSAAHNTAVATELNCQLQSKLAGYIKLTQAQPQSSSAASTPVSQPTTAAGLQSDAAVHSLLLTLVVLYWAAYQPARVGGGEEVADCSFAVTCAYMGLEAAATGTLSSRLWDVVRTELPPLVSKVATGVLRSAMTNSIDSPATTSTASSSSSSRSATSGSSSGNASSSSSIRISRRATASSQQPGMTALSLIQIMLKLRVREGVLIAQLLEGAVRCMETELPGVSWGSPELLTYRMGAVQECLRSLIGKIHSPSSSTSSRSLGVLLEAAQEPRPAAGGTSTEQLQLASVCFSVFKMLRRLCEAHPHVRHTPAVLLCWNYVALAASSMLQWLAAPAADLSTGSQAASQAGGSGSNPAVVVSAAVPWLALSGRVLQFVAQQLPAATASASTAGSNTTTDGPNAQTAEVLHVAAATVLDGVRAWLLMPGAAEALSAAGYDPSGSVLSCWRQLAGAVETMCDEAESSASSSSTEDVPNSAPWPPEGLQSLASSLNSLPFACACNNPACSNLSGPLELNLVKGKGTVCSGCHVGRFCSRACQVQHWKLHKHTCRAIVAAAATQATASAGDAAGDTATETAATLAGDAATVATASAGDPDTETAAASAGDPDTETAAAAAGDAASETAAASAGGADMVIAAGLAGDADAAAPAAGDSFRDSTFGR